MNNFFRNALASGLCMALSHQSFAQPTQYSLQQVVEMARSQSAFSKQAETSKEISYWQYRYYKSDFNPQLRLRGSLPEYNKDYVGNTLDNSTIAFQPREQSNGYANLSLEQPIFLTGGNLSINSDLTRYNDFIYNIESWRTTLVNIQLQQPILRFNILKWNRKTEPLRYEESKRSYVEEMEFISRQATDKFFSVLDAQINLQIATFNLANNDTIYKIAQGRYNMGTTARDILLQAELQLLTSRKDVVAAKISLENNKLDMRSYIGLKSDEDFALLVPGEIPTLILDPDEALQRAKENRSDFIAFERRKMEAERGVAEARGQRFEVDVTASFGLNKEASDWEQSYQDPLRQQRFNVSFLVPVLDWGRNKARMRSAFANQKLSEYQIAQDEVIFSQEIVTQVRQFDVLLSQIEITQKSDEVAQERYMVSQNRYLIGKIDITNLNIALREKDDAKRNYLSALRSYWTSYFDLRRLTLYDFSTKQLLYVPE